jgi:hypothetical protein
LSQSDGHDAPWLALEFVPCVATVVDDIVVAKEDAVGQPVVAHELPDVFLRVQLGTFGREEYERDVAGDVELAGGMPTRLIEQQDGVASRRDLLGDFIEMQLHRLGVAPRQDQADRLAFFRADRAEDVGRGGALVARRRGPRSALGPAAGDLVLLSDAGFVGEPDFYSAGIDALFARDFLQAGRETFLKSSIAPRA